MNRDTDKDADAHVHERASQTAVLGMGIVTLDQVAAHVVATIVGAVVAIYVSDDSDLPK